MHWKSSSHPIPYIRHGGFVVHWLSYGCISRNSFYGSVFMLVIRELCMRFGRQKWNSSHIAYSLKIMQGAKHWVSWSCWLGAASIPTSPLILIRPPLQLLWILATYAAQWWRAPDFAAGHPCMGPKLEVMRDRLGLQLVHVGSSYLHGVQSIIVLINIQLFFLTVSLADL